MTKHEELVALAACPFCGGNRLEGGGDDKFVGYRCLDCEAVGPNHYLTGRDWNLRAQASAAPPEREAKLREVLSRFNVDEYVAGYEFRDIGGECGDHVPTDDEKALITDALHGAIAEIEALSSRDDGEGKSSDGGVLGSLPSGESGPMVTSASSPSEALVAVTGPIQPGDVLRYEIDEVTRVGKVTEHLRPSEAPSTISADVLAMKGACKQAALDAVQSLRHAGAANFMDARYAGQRGCDHADALYDAYKAIGPAIDRIDVLGKPMPRGGISLDWHAESIKLYRQNKSLRKCLKEQHDWHLAQGEKDFGDGITLNMADEYSESGMCERTTAALDATLPPGIEGYQAWKAKQTAPAAEQVVAVSVDELRSFIFSEGACTALDLARALLDKYSIRSALMTEGSE